MTNKKIVLSRPEQAKLAHDKTKSPLNPLLNISACGICATDRKGFLSPPDSMKLPLVPGHEFCGTLISTGKRVVVWPAISCGHCSFCKRERYNLCENLQLFGLHLDGGFQQQFSLPQVLADKAVFIKIPTELNWDHACMAEPLGCVIHSLAMITQAPETVCIYGAGLMGILAARLIKHQWPHCLIEVRDPDPLRQKLFSPSPPPKKQVELVFLACSDPTAVSKSLERLKPGGHMLLFSGLNRDDNPLRLDYNRIHRLEQTLHGSYGCLPIDMEYAVDLMAKRSIVVEDLITKRIPLEQVPDALIKVENSHDFKTIITTI